MVQQNLPESLSSTSADANLAAALSRAGLGHRLCEGGGYAIDIVFDRHGLRPGRSHRVIASSKRIERFGITFRRVYAMGFRTEGSPGPEEMRALLNDNRFMLLGSWSVHRDEDGRHRAVYQMLVPADVEPELLKKAVLAVALTADEMEERITGEDQF